MKLIQIVHQLENMGHKVKYRVRSDGGIIITQIDNKHFTRAGTGNKLAREMTGIELSAARATQTAYNVQKFIKLNKNYKHKASSLGDDEKLKNLTKKVQKAWRKNKTIGEGKVTIRKVRWLQKHKGVEEAEDYLNRRFNYSWGIAYPENVLYWAGRVRMLSVGEDASLVKKTDDMADAMERQKDYFKQSVLEDIHDIDYDKSLSRPEKIRKIEELLKREKVL